MKKYAMTLLVSLTLFLAILLVCSPVTHAQNWIEMPPYNTLWPLWSPALSPLNDVTGLPTPIVSSLAPDTELPVMPGLTWDPALPYPWLLYNTVTGLAYFDPLAGINLWPAPSLLDDAGLAAPIPLPVGYADLPPTDAAWLSTNVHIANNSYLLAYSSFLPTLAGPAWLATPPPLTSLLTPLDILGPTLGAASALAPVPPPLPAPVPTVPVPALPAPTIVAPTLATPTAAISQVVAEQAGTWIGNWYLGFLYGDMTMVLIESTLSGSLQGTVTLSGNLALLNPVVQVYGTSTAGSINVSGLDTTGNFVLQINGILTSPTDMIGTWSVLNLSGIVVKNGTGNFEVSLANTTLVAPAPIVTPAIPVPTVVAPTAIAPTILAAPVVSPTAPVPTLPAPTLPVPTIPAPIAPIPTLLAPTIPVPTVVAPTAAISQLVPLFLVEQAGSWNGIWTNGLYSGPMTLNLVEDPIFGTLVGYVQLLGNPYLGSLVDVTGEVVNNQIYLTGSGIGLGTMTFTIDITGTLLDPTTMTGQYTLINATSIVETGSFDLSLLPPII
ncbi:MAG: hypothetical protein ACMUJM_12375 [bacterium]